MHEIRDVFPEEVHSTKRAKGEFCFFGRKLQLDWMLIGIQLSQEDKRGKGAEGRCQGR